MTKNRYNFDSFTLDGYCCVGCCLFCLFVCFKFDSLSEKRSVPRLHSWEVHVVKILAAHQLKITDLAINGKSSNKPTQELFQPIRQSA